MFNGVKYLFFIYSLVFPFLLFSQEIAPCELPDNKKAQKLYEEAMAEKKPSVRRELLEQALELEPEHYQARYQFAYENIKLAEKNPMGSYAFAAKHLEQVIQECPNYHPYPYYYLGNIAMGKKDYEKAVQYFTKFMKLEYANVSDYPKDYEKRMEEAEQLKKDAEFYANVYKNPVPFEPSVVTGISTQANEYLGIISHDNEMALYIRNYEKLKKGDLTPKQVEEFTVSYATANGFDGGVAMPPPFNMTENVGGATISVNNKKLYLTICKFDMEGYKNCDIYTSDFVNGEWTEPVSVGEGVNQKNSFEGQPSVSADGKTMYFVSIREDEIGAIDNMDLYKSELQPDGKWGKATNLGRKINTSGNEKSPFIHSDSHTLYFSSDGQKGLGGFDIFYCRQDSSGNFTSPVNIGYPINSENDDVGFFVSADSKTAFFSSNELKTGVGGWDMYSFHLYKEARPEMMRIAKGELKDDGGNPVTTAKIELKNIKTKEIQQIDVDSLTGEYVSVMNMNTDYIMTVKSEGAAFTSQFIAKEDTASPITKTVQKIDFEVKKIETGSAHRINNINFETNSYQMDENSKLVLDEFILFLKDNPAIKISIHGHTDDIGNDADNMTLSQNRAQAVYNYIAQKGIDKSRLNYKGFGETKFLVQNSTEENRAKNRRTEFVIVEK
ncbi:MAG: hypothetical protein POELPBGB_02569 [Bacteroidia bacterium]|nr:hypothetical protein [Bacteroidia bacterium]